MIIGFPRCRLRFGMPIGSTPMSSLLGRVRCCATGHTTREYTYKSIATSAGEYRHPECCQDGLIQIRREHCTKCGQELAWHPVEYTED